MTDTPADERLTIMWPISGRLGRELSIAVSDQAVIMTEGEDGEPPTVIWDGFARDEVLVRVEGPASLVAETLRTLTGMADDAMHRRMQERVDALEDRPEPGDEIAYEGDFFPDGEDPAEPAAEQP